jgi:hypothetical protein
MIGRAVSHRWAHALLAVLAVLPVRAQGPEAPFVDLERRLGFDILVAGQLAGSAALAIGTDGRTGGRHQTIA